MGELLDLRGVKPFRYSRVGLDYEVRFYGRRVGRITKTKRGWYAFGAFDESYKTREEAAKALVEAQAPFGDEAA